MAQLDVKVAPKVSEAALPSLDRAAPQLPDLDLERRALSTSRGEAMLTRTQPQLVAQAVTAPPQAPPVSEYIRNSYVQPTNGALRGVQPPPSTPPQTPTGRGFGGSRLGTAAGAAGAAGATQLDGPLPFIDAAVTGLTVGTIMRPIPVPGTGTTVEGLADRAMDNLFGTNKPPASGYSMSQEEQRAYLQKQRERDPAAGSPVRSVTPNTPTQTPASTTNTIPGGGTWGAPEVPVPQPSTAPALDPAQLERARRSAEQQRTAELAEARKLEQSIKNFDNYRLGLNVHDAAAMNPPNLAPGVYGSAMRFENKSGENYAQAAQRTVRELSAENKIANQAALRNPDAPLQIAFGRAVDVSGYGMGPKNVTAPFEATATREQLAEALSKNIITTDDLKRNGIPMNALIKDRPSVQIGDSKQDLSPNPDRNQSGRSRIGDSPDQLSPKGGSIGDRVGMGDRPGELLDGDRSNGRRVGIEPGKTPIINSPTGAVVHTGDQKTTVTTQINGNQVFTGANSGRPEVDLTQKPNNVRPGEAIAGIPSRPEPGWGNGFEGSAQYENKLAEWERQYGDKAEREESSGQSTDHSSSQSSNNSSSQSTSNDSGGFLGWLFGGGNNEPSESSSNSSSSSRTSRNTDNLGYGSSAQDYANNLTRDEIERAMRQFGSNPTVEADGNRFTADKGKLREALQLQEARERQHGSSGSSGSRSSDTSTVHKSAGQEVGRGNEGVVTRFGDRVRKTGPDVDSNEADMLRKMKQEGIRVPGVRGEGFDRNGKYYFEMDYVEGKNLLKYLETEKDPRRLEAVRRDLKDQFERLERAGIDPGDLQGFENYIVSPDGKVTLIDPSQGRVGVNRNEIRREVKETLETFDYYLDKARSSGHGGSSSGGGYSGEATNHNGRSTSSGRGNESRQFHDEMNEKAKREGAEGRTAEQQRLLDQLEERRRGR